MNGSAIKISCITIKECLQNLNKIINQSKFFLSVCEDLEPLKLHPCPEYVAVKYIVGVQEGETNLMSSKERSAILLVQIEYSTNLTQLGRSYLTTHICCLELIHPWR